MASLKVLIRAETIVSHVHYTLVQVRLSYIGYRLELQVHDTAGTGPAGVGKKQIEGMRSVLTRHFEGEHQYKFNACRDR